MVGISDLQTRYLKVPIYLTGDGWNLWGGVCSGCLFAALTLWIVWLLYRAVKTLLDQRDGTPVAPRSGPAEAVLRQAAQWWREAQDLAQQGDYAGACRALYMAGLIRLKRYPGGALSL